VPDIAQLRVIAGESAVVNAAVPAIGGGRGTVFPAAATLHVTLGRSTEVGIQVEAIADHVAGQALPLVLICPVVEPVARTCQRYAIPTGPLWNGSGRRELLVSLLPSPVLAAVEGTRVRLTVAYTAN
jgi:hypothetical protein